MTDPLNLVDCANDFVGSSEHCLSVFGNVPDYDVLLSTVYPSSSTKVHQQAVFFPNFSPRPPFWKMA